MSNSDKLTLLGVAVIVGIIIAWGISYKSKLPSSSNTTTSISPTENRIKNKVKDYIEENLSKGEKYKPLKWEGGSFTNKSGHTTVYSGAFSMPSSKWSTLTLTHTFVITNKEGCDSHFCKQIRFDENENITDYTNMISGKDFTGIESVTGMSEGPLRNCNSEELIIWGEDKVRSYIYKNIDSSQRHIPLEWVLYTKLTLDKNVFDALDITFSPIQQAADFHPRWIHAALCIEHKYRIEGVEGYKETIHSEFIVNPKGKVKEVPYFYFTKNKSAEEHYSLLFTDFE